jgi:hypothetical protein
MSGPRLAHTVEADGGFVQLRADDDERAILGDALMRPEAAIPEYIALGIKPESFGKYAHRLIWRAMVRLGSVTSLVSLKTELESSDELEEVGGIRYVTTLVDGLPRATPEKRAHHAGRVLNIARRRQVRDDLMTTLKALEDDDHDVADLVADLRERLVQRASVMQNSLLLDDAEIIAEPDALFLVENFIAAESLSVLYGPSGVGKSFLALDWSLSLAAERCWFGQPVIRGNTVYIAAEGVRGLKRRIAAWKASRGLPLDVALGVYVWPEAVNLLDDAEVDRLLRASESRNPIHMVVDTLNRCYIGNENDQGDMGRFVAACDRLRRELGVTVTSVHHSRKDGAAERGSSVLRGAADSMFSLTAIDDVLTLATEKQKDVAPAEPVKLKLASYDGSLILKLADDVDARDVLSPQQAKVLDRMRTAFSEGASRKDVAAACADMPFQSVYRAMDQLVRKGFATSRGKRVVPVFSPPKASVTFSDNSQ